MYRRENVGGVDLRGAELTSTARSSLGMARELLSGGWSDPMSQVHRSSPAKPRRKEAGRGKALGRKLSWVALLAATSVDVDSVVPVNAEIRGELRLASAEETNCRLVVQSYSACSFDGRGVPPTAVRPLGSLQRSVSASELRSGVRVQLLEVGPEPSVNSRSVLVAWVEPGLPNLDFDGLMARPGPGAVVGMSFAAVGASGNRARIVVSSRATG